MSKMNNDILMRQIENTFSYFTEQVLHKGHWNNHPADIAALTAVDVLANYCTSMGKHCQECIFNDEDDMCDLFARIKREIAK